MRARRGTLDQESRAGSPVKVRFVGTASGVIYFSNEPRRIAGEMPTSMFLKRWIKPPPHDWASEPPNAALAFRDPRSGRQEVRVLELLDPGYDAARGTLVFTVRPLPGGNLDLPPRFTDPIITLVSPTVCGTLGAWGNLPGEQQYDPECHKAPD